LAGFFGQATVASPLSSKAGAGAEFKIASYLCRQLEKQEVVGTTITALSRATGVSWRQTQACLQSLAKDGVLLVRSQQHSINQ
jgi:hypothetical protein